MFKLKLYDRIGNELHPGDVVKVSDGKNITFYAEVMYLEKEQCITPFHTFSFHSFEKVDKMPDDAVKCSEERYNIWFTHSPEVDPVEAVEAANKYLIDWRAVEHLLEQRCFRIELEKQITLFLTINICNMKLTILIFSLIFIQSCWGMPEPDYRCRCENPPIDTIYIWQSDAEIQAVIEAAKADSIELICEEI